MIFSSLAAPCYHDDNPGTTRDDKAPDSFKWISLKMLYLTSYWDQSLHDTFFLLKNVFANEMNNINISKMTALLSLQWHDMGITAYQIIGNSNVQQLYQGNKTKTLKLRITDLFRVIQERISLTKGWWCKTCTYAKTVYFHQHGFGYDFPLIRILLGYDDVSTWKCFPQCLPLWGESTGQPRFSVLKRL